MHGDFSEQMAALKQEVTNLKIAHTRGLGNVQFYQGIHGARLDIGRLWRVRLTAVDGAILPFIAHLYFSFDFGYDFTVAEPVKVEQDGHSIVYSMNYATTNYVYIKAICTSDFEITTEVL